MPTINFTGTRDELMQLLYSLGPKLAGKEPDATGAIDKLKLRAGQQLLGKIKESFEIKSRGGVDDMGIEWAPLSAVTLALRRIVNKPAVLQALKEQFRKLPPSQRAKVTAASRRLYRLLTGQDEAGRKHALSILKRKAPLLSKTRIKELTSILSGKIKDERAKKLAFAGSFALILRDTGKLLNSLSPGTANTAERILESKPGVIIVGTKTQYAVYHQSDKPRIKKKDGSDRLPRRQFLPDSGKPTPQTWLQLMVKSMSAGLGEKAFWSQYAAGKIA